MKLKDKVVIITGASSGIGKSLAFELAARGSKLALGARSEDKLNEIADEVAAKYDRPLTVVTDVSVENDCKNLVLSTVEKYGKIDVLISNAGTSMRALFAETEISVLKKLMDVNFWGAVYCIKHALPYLVETSGSFVGVSSAAGYKGLPGRSGYSASKFALQGFLETLRIENRKTGLHVMIACPGFTKSNIRNKALGGDGSLQGESPRNEDKMMTSEQVARHIANAVEKRKKTLLLTTQSRSMILVNKFFPGFIDRQVYNYMAKEPDSPFK